MDSSRRLVAVAIVCFLIGAAGIAAAVHITGTVETSGDIPLVAPDGMEVHVVGDTEQLLENNFPTSGSVDVITEAGNVSFFSSGDANATVTPQNTTGTWTNVTHLEADPNTVTVTPEDKAQVVVGNEINSIAFKDSSAVGIDDSTVDFVYGGSTGQSRVTIQGAPSNQELAAVDATTGSILDVATSTNSGAITFDALDNSQHPVLLQSTDFDNPTLSNPSPTGDLSNPPSSISVDVADGDFPDGDSVDVTIQLDGTQIHSETITANQTVSVPMPQSGQTAGSHQWRVDADPDFGVTETQIYDYRVPANLTIRNERDHSQIIKSGVSANVTFFGDDVIVTRQTNDGNISLDGLPVNQDFIAEVQPNKSQWTTRSVYFESIYQQQSIYLLNTSAVNTVESRFVLNDPTGQYGSESIVYIQRPINISGTTTWQTVHSDEFGAEGVTMTLEEGQRYRVRVENENGREQLVGPYRADVSETVEVQPGTPGIEVNDFEDGWGANAVLDDDELSYLYSDPQDQTDQVTVWIHEKGDESHRLQANQSYFNLGNFSAQTNLNSNEKENTWVVNFIVERGDTEFVKSIEVSNRKTLFPGLPEPWDAIAGIVLLLLLAGVFSEINVSSGAIVVASVGGILYYVQLLGGAPTAIGIMLGMFIAVVNRLRKSGGP